jgi:hypothetical protein
MTRKVHAEKTLKENTKEISGFISVVAPCAQTVHSYRTAIFLLTFTHIPNARHRKQKRRSHCGFLHSYRTGIFMLTFAAAQ